MRNVTIVGVGRLGGAIALALSRKGVDVGCLVHRSPGIAENVVRELSGSPVLLNSIPELKYQDLELVLITTGDPEIVPVTAELEKILSGKETVLHTSGSLSSEILSGLGDIGCSIGSMHPLVSISDYSTGADSFEGAFFCVEGDATGYSAGVEIANILGGLPFVVDTGKKALYHAAAVMACGHVTALIDLANEMIERCGINGQDASKILIPLIESTIGNIGKHGTDRALTGSFARADADAVRRHIGAMEGDMDSETMEIYRALGEASLKIAERNGTDSARIAKVRELIRGR